MGLNGRQKARSKKQKPNNVKDMHETYIEENIINKGRIDPLILISLILLITFGIIMVFSASYYEGKIENNDVFYFVKKQVMFAIIGFSILPFLCKLDWRIFKKLSPLIYIASCILLVLVPIIGTERGGAKRWISIFGIVFQPSEIAKIGLILFLSKYISENKKILDTWNGFFRCCIIIAIPTALILIENASTAIIILVIGVSIIFVASPTIKYFVPFTIAGVIGFVTLILFGQGFRMARFEAWLNPFSEGARLNTGYQTVQSLYAIASGGVFGLGLGQSRQKLGYLPESQNDIIFSIICEELGLFGAIIFIMLFCVLIWRGYVTALHSPKKYMSYVSIGITTMIAVHTIINVCVATNTIPNTGVPLPFVSYGGTALIIMISSIGVVLNFSRFFRD